MFVIWTVLFYALLQHAPVEGQTCPTTQKVNIDDTRINEEIYNLTLGDSVTYSNSFSVIQSDGLDTETAKSYFSFEQTDQSLYVYTTQAYENLGKDAHSSGIPVLPILISVNCNCGKITFAISITDSYRNSPVFSKTVYDYAIPMPIMPKTDIALFGETMIVTDNNFSNDDIIFSVSPADFTVSTTKMTNNKDFIAVFSAVTILMFQSNQTYTLTATDSGGKSSSVDVVISVDSSNGLDDPTFSSPYYTFIYSAGTLKPTSDDITINSNKMENAIYQLAGNDDQLTYFQLEADPNSKTFSLKLSDIGIPDDVSGQIVITLSYSTDYTTTATLLIDIERDDVVPNFSSNFYRGTYDPDSNSITWTEKVVIENANDIILSGGKASLFTIDKSTFEIKPTGKLSNSDFDDNSNILLTITATSNTGTEAQASVVVSLKGSQAEGLQFNKVYYDAVYELDGPNASVRFIDGNSIGFTGISDLTGIAISVDGNYNTYFEAEEIDDEWVINVVNLLPQELLDENEQISVVLTASKTGLSNTATSVLVLKLPATLKFNSILYEAIYAINDDTATVKFADGSNIGFAGITDLTGIVIEVEDSYTKNFEVKQSNNEWVIEVKENLDTSVLVTNEQLSIVLTASKPESNTTTTSVLLLKLPENGLKFSSAYYDATYSVDDDKATVTLADGNSIGFSGVSEFTGIIVNVEDSYKSNFVVTQNSDQEWIINVDQLLNSSVLDANEQLQIVLTASKTGSVSITKTVLVLKLPAKELKFSSVYYDATYSVDGDTAKVTLAAGNSIGFTGLSDLTGITITVEDAYKSNFAVTQESDNWVINVVGRLDDKVLKTNGQLSIILTASKTGLATPATAVLVLKLPETDFIQFERSYYTGYYVQNKDVTDSVTLDDKITVTGASYDTITFELDDYQDYFQIDFDINTSSYKLTVKSDLSSQVLKSNTELVITVTAKTTTDSASSTLIIKLPDQSVQLAFAKSHYRGRYNLSNNVTDQVTLDDGVIEIVKSDDLDIDFSLAGYEDYLELIPSTDSDIRYTVGVKKNLDPSILNSETRLIMTITAYVTNNRLVYSNTVLILDLPNNSPTLSFDKSYYKAKYSTDSDVLVVTDGPIQIKNDDKLQIEFEMQDYKDNFELVYDDTTQQVSVHVKAQLANSIIETNSKVLATAMVYSTDGIYQTSATLIIDLPTLELSFADKHYTAIYLKDSEVVLSSDIVLHSDYSKVSLTFQEYAGNFALKIANTEGTAHSYTIETVKPLSDSVLNSNTQIVLEIKAESVNKTDSTVVVLKLPAYTDIGFEATHYAAEYLLNTEGTDSINPIDTIRVRDGYTQIGFEDYNDNFQATCDSTTLECTVTIVNNLSPSVLSSNDELLITLTASNSDKTSQGKSLYLLKLPAKTSTFSFAQQHYIAAYSIERTANVSLASKISLIGINSTEVSITLDDYSEYFQLQYSEATWDLELIKNLTADILSKIDELVIPLTASKNDKSDPGYAKASLSVILPNKISVGFLKTHYYAQYEIDSSGNPLVILDSDIETLSPENSEIVLDAFSGSFSFSLDDDKKWSLKAKLLSDSVLTRYSELKLVMTITKLGVKYGQAGLTITLPSFQFSKSTYTASYSIDEQEIGHLISPTITIANIDVTNAEIDLADYRDYFDVSLADEQWTVTLSQSLPHSIISLHKDLVTHLVANRRSDGKTLATSTLVVSIPAETATEPPKFTNFTYNFQYVNSDPPQIVSDGSIAIENTNSVTVTSVFIDSFGRYEDNFKFDSDDDQYSFSIIDPLDQDVWEEVSSLSFTLVAKSSTGSYGYATVVIDLPKARRNSSIVLKNDEVLYTGIYKDGQFTSPNITLLTADDISVGISNDLGIDNSYFFYNYTDQPLEMAELLDVMINDVRTDYTYLSSNKILTVGVEQLPDSILNNYTVIPLRLAITDKTTQDTVNAVVNVDLDYAGGGAIAGGGSNTGLIIAIAILAILLALVLLLTFCLWYRKIRVLKREHEIIDEEITTDKKTTTFVKKETKKLTPTNSLRRPTGLPLSSPTDDDDKTVVAFDENVENIDDDDENRPNGLKKVADRRPTQFVFLEGRLPDARRDSSDYDATQPNTDDKKKSVAFDDVVERRNIDPLEEDDDDDIEEGPTIFRTEADFEIKDDKVLPSEVFKDRF